jgi:hypothetical protein
MEALQLAQMLADLNDLQAAVSHPSLASDTRHYNGFGLVRLELTAYLLCHYSKTSLLRKTLSPPTRHSIPKNKQIASRIIGEAPPKVALLHLPPSVA